MQCSLLSAPPLSFLNESSVSAEEDENQDEESNTDIRSLKVEKKQMSATVKQLNMAITWKGMEHIIYFFNLINNQYNYL